MLARSPLHHAIRVTLALVLAVLVSARGGGAALACDTPRTAVAHGAEGKAMAGMASMAASQDSQHPDDCDAPKQAPECSLMTACAPALSASVRDAEILLTPESFATVWRVRTPAPVDRSPEPPPPRS